MPPEQETPVAPETYSESVVDALVDAIRAATSPEMTEAQAILLRRLALSGDVVPSRIPPPATITEVGGYLNLLEQLGQPELRAQVLASMFGVAGPNPPLGWAPPRPVLFFVSRRNDRGAPGDDQAAAIPVQFSVRNDFAPALDDALKEIHELGCQLPVLSGPRALPPAEGVAPAAADLLRYLGRTLELVPSAALRDPDADMLALARTGTGALEVVARQLNSAAPRAAEVSEESWVAWECTATACQETTANRKYLALTEILNTAGWYQPDPAPPRSLAQAGDWWRWTNVSGLVAGVTTYADELRLLYSAADIAASALRDRLDWVWDGTVFAAS